MHNEGITSPFAVSVVKCRYCHHESRAGQWDLIPSVELMQRSGVYRDIPNRSRWGMGLRMNLWLQTALADSIAAEAALGHARSAVHAAAEAGKLHEHPMGMDRTMERDAARRSLECTHRVKEAEAVSVLPLHKLAGIEVDPSVLRT